MLILRGILSSAFNIIFLTCCAWEHIQDDTPLIAALVLLAAVIPGLGMLLLSEILVGVRAFRKPRQHSAFYIFWGLAFLPTAHVVVQVTEGLWQPVAFLFMIVPMLIYIGCGIWTVVIKEPSKEADLPCRSYYEKQFVRIREGQHSHFNWRAFLAGPFHMVETGSYLRAAGIFLLPYLLLIPGYEILSDNFYCYTMTLRMDRLDIPLLYSHEVHLLILLGLHLLCGFRHTGWLYQKAQGDAASIHRGNQVLITALWIGMSLMLFYCIQEIMPVLVYPIIRI